jgi:hypothetical protein
MTTTMSGQADPAISYASTPSRVATWARTYARLGWRVYPVERGGKRPMYAGWLADATTDAPLIDRWWPRDSGAPNLGVVAGEGFDVFDIEAPHVEAFEAAAPGRVLPETPIARSGRGGLHIYITTLGLGTRRLVLHGMHIGELKGSGGVVVPPSVTTGRYEWLRDPSVVMLDAAPRWMRAMVTEARPMGSAPVGRLTPSRAVALMAGLYRVVSEAREGERNGMLYWATRRVAEHGIDRDAAIDILLAAALTAGLAEREARATIASGLRS